MRALILSCGPSLVRFDGNTAGYDVVIGVNNVVARFPLDWWVFGDVEVLQREHQRMLVEPRALFVKHDFSCPLPSGWWFRHKPRLRWWDIQGLGNKTPVTSGPAALFLAWFLGVRDVDCWGVDMDGGADFEGVPSVPVGRWPEERAWWQGYEDAMTAQGIRVVRHGCVAVV